MVYSNHRKAGGVIRNPQLSPPAWSSPSHRDKAAATSGWSSSSGDDHLPFRAFRLIDEASLCFLESPWWYIFCEITRAMPSESSSCSIPGPWASFTTAGVKVSMWLFFMRIPKELKKWGNDCNMIRPHVSFDPRRVGEIARTFLNGVISLQNS